MITLATLGELTWTKDGQPTPPPKVLPVDAAPLDRIAQILGSYAPPYFSLLFRSCLSHLVTSHMRSGPHTHHCVARALTKVPDLRCGSPIFSCANIFTCAPLSHWRECLDLPALADMDGRSRPQEECITAEPIPLLPRWPRKAAKLLDPFLKGAFPSQPASRTVYHIHHELIGHGRPTTASGLPQSYPGFCSSSPTPLRD